MGNLLINQKDKLLYPTIFGFFLLSGYILIKPITRMIAQSVEKNFDELKKKHRPKRIVLIRHGFSEGNENMEIYGKVPNHKIKLTQKGVQQAIEAGEKLKEIIKMEEIKFIISPFTRTRQTFREISSSLEGKQFVIEEDSLLKEQESGNFMKIEKLQQTLKERDEVSTFFYRFEGGESASDVYDRATLFLTILFRQFDRMSINNKKRFENVGLVTHGLFIKCFLMRLFNWTLEEFEKRQIPDNCQIIVLEKDSNGKYHFDSNCLKIKENGENDLVRENK